MREEKHYLTIERFNQIPWLVHGFGLAGFSFSELNGDQQLQAFIPIAMNQQHSARVFYLEEKPENQLSGDGLITSRENLLLLIKTADCLPLFLVDTENRAVAAVHCGWRGTAQKISAKTFELMQQKVGSKPENLLAALGPCIEQNCYEVGEEVYKAFSEAGFPGSIFLPAKKDGKFFLDLRAANFWLLKEVLSIPEKNIYQINLCTFCHPELISYRRDKTRDQRLINFIGLRKSA